MACNTGLYQSNVQNRIVISVPYLWTYKAFAKPGNHSWLFYLYLIHSIA